MPRPQARFSAKSFICCRSILLCICFQSYRLGLLVYLGGVCCISKLLLLVAHCTLLYFVISIILVEINNTVDSQTHGQTEFYTKSLEIILSTFTGLVALNFYVHKVVAFVGDN